MGGATGNAHVSRAVSLGGLLLLGLVGPSVWAGACVIPERTYDARLADEIARLDPGRADAGSDGGQRAGDESSLCEEYCTTIMSLDKCGASAAVYESTAQCLAVCRQLPEGSPGAISGNSVQCRLNELRTPDFEPNDCSHVGPVSFGGTCGDPCLTFCELQRTACGNGEEAYCTSACSVLKQSESYNIDQFANTDTLQCRVNILARALGNGSSEECSGARIAPSSQNFACQDGPNFPVVDDREYYCDLMGYSCQGDDAVYENEQQCRAVADVLDVGGQRDFNVNTLRCRRLHAYYSLGNEKTMHCRHAGPTGDGGCGSNCDSFCRILARGCPDAFNGTFASTEGVDAHAACVSDCTGLPDASNGAFGTVRPFYSVNSTPPEGTLKCRTLNAVRALATPDDPQLCTAAFGALDSPCAPPNPDVDVDVQ